MMIVMVISSHVVCLGTLLALGHDHTRDDTRVLVSLVATALRVKLVMSPMENLVEK